MCGLLYTVYLFCNTIPYFIEQLKLQTDALLLGSDNFLFYLLQFRSHISFRVGEGLFPYISVRNLIEKTLCDFNIISEYLVILNPQIPDSGLFPFLGFKVENPLFSAGLRFPVLIQDFGITFPDDSALCNDNGGVGMNSTFKQICQIFKRIELIADPDHFFAVYIAKKFPDSRYTFQTGGKGKTVTGIHVPVSYLVHQAFHVINAFQFLGNRHAENSVVNHFLYSIQAVINLPFIQQGLFHPSAQQSTTHGCTCQIQKFQKSSLSAFPSQALCQFKIPPGILVQKHGLSVFSEA